MQATKMSKGLGHLLEDRRQEILSSLSKRKLKRDKTPPTNRLEVNSREAFELVSK